MRIASTHDLEVYLADARADVGETGGTAAVLASVEALRAADHPAWGADWSDWLDDPDTQAIITEAAVATWGEP